MDWLGFLDPWDPLAPPAPPAPQAPPIEWALATWKSLTGIWPIACLEHREQLAYRAAQGSQALRGRKERRAPGVETGPQEWTASQANGERKVFLERRVTGVRPDVKVDHQVLQDPPDHLDRSFTNHQAVEEKADLVKLGFRAPLDQRETQVIGASLVATPRVRKESQGSSWDQMEGPYIWEDWLVLREKLDPQALKDPLVLTVRPVRRGISVSQDDQVVLG